MSRLIPCLAILLVTHASHASPRPLRDSVLAVRDQLASQAEAYRQTRAVKMSQRAFKVQYFAGVKLASGVAKIRRDGTERSQRVRSVGLDAGVGGIFLVGKQDYGYELSQRRLRSGTAVPRFDLRMSAGVGFLVGFETNLKGTHVGVGVGLNIGTLELMTNFRQKASAPRTIPGLRVADKAHLLAERAIAAYDAGDLKPAELALPRLQHAAARIAKDQQQFSVDEM
jgi:hypothetical protein